MVSRIPARRSGRGILAIGLVVISGLVLSGFSPKGLFTSDDGEWVLDREVTPADSLPEGFVVWSSNRAGTHDIYKMTLPDKEIIRLTDHPHVDYHPRISPDGKKVVFARSREPGVSHRNQLDWDVILLDLETGKERQLAEYGNFPTWSPNGDAVHYQYRIEQFAEHELDSGEQKILFHGGMGHLKKGVGLQTPNLRPDGGKMAVTLRYKQHLIGTVDRQGRIQPIADGCQLTWSPEGDFLYFVDYGGRMKNAVYVYKPGGADPRLWFDMPGEFSHEYFPKLSHDERWLVFGASRGEKAHEHDQADFENFIWQVGTPIETATRLTFNEANDNYPDIFLYNR